MRAVAETTASLAGELARCHNVLLKTPTLGESDGAACSSLLSAIPAEEADVLCVSFTQSPDTRLEHWQTADGPTDPANLGFIVVEGSRSATAARPATEGPSNGDLGPTIGSVTSPADLTGLGIELGNVFADWIGDETRLALCFHTLTTFLQYADLRTAYRFVHTLTGRVQSADGIAHYHLDPTAHDERTVNTLEGLFDGIVEQETDGSWDVRRRR